MTGMTHKNAVLKQRWVLHQGFHCAPNWRKGEKGRRGEGEAGGGGGGEKRKEERFYAIKTPARHCAPNLFSTGKINL